MANHLVRASILPIVCLLACAGCVAIWQNDYVIETSSEHAVSINYDPLLLAPDRAASAAQFECQKFQRIAVLERIRRGRTWTKVADFRCEDSPINRSGSMEASATTTETGSASYRSLPSPFPDAPRSEVATAVKIPAIPTNTTAQATENPTNPSDLPTVLYIDATGPSSGVTHRQIVKSHSIKTRVESAQASIPQPSQFSSRAEPAHVHNIPSHTPASLKGSLVS